MIENKQIAIVGGGPGGLTLARLLQLAGAHVKVYERDASKASRVQGAIVDLHFDSGLKVIEKAGLMESFKANYIKGADRYRIFDKYGTIHLDEHNKADNGDFGDPYFRPEIDRGSLRNMLLDTLHPNTVVWDSQFVSMTQDGEGWILTFKNGTTAQADIVIGSDGARSKIRPYISDTKTLYCGVTIIQGDIDNPAEACPEIYELVANGNLVVLADGKSITVQPRGDGGLTFYAAAKYPEDWTIDASDKEEVYSFLTVFYEGWNEIFFTLFKACDKFTVRQLNYFPLDQTWEPHSNITIIGDAAHLMPPSGEGVNTAMLDALDLSEHLTNGNYGDIQTAIGAFENKMRARSAVLAQEALEGNEVMYGENALEALVGMLDQRESL
ncbi:NAD(P)/FAD-dependent oxidoreductase [Chitinophaga sancti]|uniref:NAD(P)/FAD-dependent oxidoreductase n=1 Tax=Chitinophaga sancti TaxID=1004 RepID=UPI002A766C9F|nr:NAD(P)/FAD-dependent oxidoreductase [Chitinophaga sancti]WPQ61670.1 NAD(P)/FAD-dependent oxidoreductase [Chitinophaga sancti]